MNLSFGALLYKLKNKDVYMIVGNGSKNQFRDISSVKKKIKEIAEKCDENSVFLYFGDPPNKKKPDVGLLFEYLHKFNKKIKIYMIQREKVKKWGIAPFVSGVYWHRELNKKCSANKNKFYGGIIGKSICSNTKKWVDVHKKLDQGIKKIYFFGGGDIAKHELMLCKKLGIDYKYFPVKRRFMGDGKTKVKINSRMKNSVGITWDLFKKKTKKQNNK